LDWWDPDWPFDFRCVEGYHNIWCADWEEWDYWYCYRYRSWDFESSYRDFVQDFFWGNIRC
jgi:hypothetical protein